MRHIFVLHSHITYIMAVEVINYNKLNKNTIVFLTMRNYKIPDKNYKSLILNDHPIGGKNFIKNWYFYYKLRKEMYPHTREKFKLYLPHSHNPNFLNLIINKNCISYSYIEEGLASYFTKNFEHTKQSLFHTIKAIIRYGSLEYCKYIYNYSWFNITHAKFEKAYALSEKSFELVKNRQLFKIANSQIKIEKNEAFIIFDGLSLFGLLPFEIINNFLHKDIVPLILSKNYQTIKFKLHPMHFKNEKGKFEADLIRNEMKSLFGGKAIEIEQEVILENYFQNFNCSVYSFYSSLGVYAAIFGNDTFSLGSKIDQLLKKDLFSGLKFKNLKQI